jgi:hypothetical protein
MKQNDEEAKKAKSIEKEAEPEVKPSEAETPVLSAKAREERESERKKATRWTGTFGAGGPATPKETLSEAFQTKGPPSLNGTINTRVGMRYDQEKLKSVRASRADKRNRAFMC